MSDARLSRLLSLFDQSVELDGPAREQFLQSVREQNRALARELERMLDADREASKQLRALVSDGALAITRPKELLSVGDRVGAYELLEVLGQGGMGTVYRARDTSASFAPHAVTSGALTASTTDVAIKVMRAGLDSTELQRRFARERRVLAHLAHPGVSRLHASGVTEQGLPYYVMDYVPSRPLDAYCAETSATVRTRLALLEATCRIMAYAHSKGVLHRDLKPANILVTQSHGRVRPVVIDFGIAHALDDGDGEPLTYLGRSPGTPEYMSPEQLTGHSGDLDARCDVYSLGVVLFELLTDVTPSGETHPSVHLRALGESAEPIAESRRCTSEQLVKMMHDALDRIVVRALEADRRFRYPSAKELGDDLQRVLESRAV